MSCRSSPGCGLRRQLRAVDATDHRHFQPRVLCHAETRRLLHQCRPRAQHQHCRSHRCARQRTPRRRRPRCDGPRAACPPRVRSGTCRTSSSHRTYRRIQRYRRSELWPGAASRICAAMPRVSRCCRWWISSAATEALCAARGAQLRSPSQEMMRGELRARRAAHVHADVPGGDGAAGVVAAADALAEHRRGGCRHDVILERVEVEQRLADVARGSRAGRRYSSVSRTRRFS